MTPKNVEKYIYVLNEKKKTERKIKWKTSRFLFQGCFCKKKSYTHIYLNGGFNCINNKTSFFPHEFITFFLIQKNFLFFTCTEADSMGLLEIEFNRTDILLFSFSGILIIAILLSVASNSSHRISNVITEVCFFAYLTQYHHTLRAVSSWYWASFSEEWSK